MTHLVAYGTPLAAGPDLEEVHRIHDQIQRDQLGWPKWMIERTDKGLTMCGVPMHGHGGIVTAWASARGYADLCPACVEAAASAGRPVAP